MTNWKTTLFGTLAAIGVAASHAGITIGHVGSTDFVSLITLISGTLFAAYSKDSNVTGGTQINSGAAGNTPVGSGH